MNYAELKDSHIVGLINKTIALLQQLHFEATVFPY